MKVLKLTPASFDQSILEAAQVLSSSGLVVHPTDTAYGLAGNIFDTLAISKIYTLKSRDLKKGLIVCVKDLPMALSLVEFNRSAHVLFEKFLPGPLTLVLPRKSHVPDPVSGNLPTLAIRLPNSPITLALSRSVDFPYTTTSANPSGGPNPYSLAAIQSSFTPEFLSQIDLALDTGPLPTRPPSTIVDLTTPTPHILRQGPITEAQILAALSV